MNITSFEDDLFITVRGIQVLKSEIRNTEQMVSGKVILDTEIQLIAALDRVWFNTFMEKKKYPQVVKLIDIPDEYYIPIRIQVHNPITETGLLDGRPDRPVWFRCKQIKIFTGRNH